MLNDQDLRFELIRLYAGKGDDVVKASAAFQFVKGDTVKDGAATCSAILTDKTTSSPKV